MTKKGLMKLVTKPHIFLKDYMKKKKSKEELKTLIEKAINLNIPSDLYYYMIFKELKKEKGSFLAEEAIKKAISVKPQGKYYYELALLLKRKSQWWQIVDALENAIKNTSKVDSKCYKEYSEALEKMNRFEDAAIALEKVEKFNTLDSDGYFRYGDLLKKVGKNDESKRMFSKAIELDQDKNSQELGIGIFYENKGLWIDAVDAYQQEVEKQPKNASLYYKLGLAHDRCYDWSSAELALLKAISLDTSFSHFFYRLGFVYERQEKWQDASKAYQYAIERQENFTPYWFYRLGYVLEKQEKYKEATEAFKEQRILQDAHGVLETPYHKNNAMNYTEYYEGYDLDENTILYESYHGSSMSCNPYAIFKSLLVDERFKSYKHIWVINDNEKIADEFKKDINIIFIKRNCDLYMRYLAKAKYLINNVTFPEYFIRKEGQIYLNTWHGTPIKSLGKDIKDEFMAHKNVTRNFLQASHLIQPNQYTTDILLNRYDVKDIISGIVAKTGYPRQDLMLNISKEEKNELKRRLNISSSDKVVLYAPTWRGEHGSAVFNTEKLKEDIQHLTSIDNTHLLFRGHHMIESLLEDLNGELVVPSEIDTNTLLSIVDVLVTDYSSIAFDYMVRGKPIVYYTYDREEYEKERGLYFPLEDLGGDICSTQKELILSLDKALKSNEISDKQRLAQEKFCFYDDGMATKRVIDLVFRNNKDSIDIVELSQKKSILLYGGQFIPNGITSSFVNLLNHIDTKKYSFTIALESNLLKNDSKRLEQYSRLESEVSTISRVGNMLLTLEEKWIYDKFTTQLSLINEKMFKIYQKAFYREFIRMFGTSNFQTVINFEGYNVFWVSLFSGLNQHLSNTVFLHNDMYGEWKLRFPYLEKNFKLYKYFDTLASVSEKTMEHNIENLIKPFSLEREKFQYVDNVQNFKDIFEKSDKALEDIQDESIFENSKVFINIARLSPEKDQEKLIRAFKNISTKYPEARLINLGSGPLENHLKHLVKELKLDKKVFLLGQRFNPYPYLKASDCFVLSSNHEGQPMTLFEALILEKPIIATDIVGNRSVLEGRPGLLVENSEDGLVGGMLDFLEDRYIEKKHFDYREYNQNALNMFYDKVVNHG